MKNTGLMLVVAMLMALSFSCVYQVEESWSSEDQALLSEGFESDPSTEAAKDCSVSIKCADGSTKSCSGTLGQCTASGSGNGSVTCNGVTKTCTTLGCVRDGICNFNCAFDIDCEPPCDPICP